MINTTDITFNDLNLSSSLLEILEGKNFKHPSPVQAQAIPHLMAGKDLIGLAQTGTGKTAAFAIPILERLDLSKHKTQALVLTPTRELGIQVAEQIKLLSRNVRVAVVCGGQSYTKQLAELSQGAHIVVATPGRAIDILGRKGAWDLNALNMFVLDEADEMLRMGFIEDVEEILAKLPKQKQIALFSATMPQRIRQIANNYLTDAVTVEIKADTATVKSIEQRFLFAAGHQKSDALVRILAVEEYQAAIVFVRTKNSTEEVAQVLQQQGLKAMAIHGDLTQSLRERIIAQFRQGTIDILVATDVAARGLDVERVDLVVNYDVPHDCETYVHRTGRTGRAGRSGVAILFITPKESRILNSIERHTRQPIEKITVPNNQMIETAKQQRFISSIKNRLEHKHLLAYQNIIQECLNEHEMNAEAVAAVLALMLNQDKPWKLELPAFRDPKAQYDNAATGRFSSRERNTRSRNDRSNDNRADRFNGKFKERRAFSNAGPQELFRLEVGKIHGVKPGNIVGAIANEAGLESRYITGLKIHDNYSTVQLPKDMPKEAFQDLNKAWVCGRQLKLTSLGAVH